MRVPLKWLADYVSTDWTPGQVAERLTMAGLEVGAVEHIGASWEGVQVAMVQKSSSPLSISLEEK